ncbi:YceD family protein [Taylorella equigenitalis]|uniref:YceD family protein n=1 Tax=Taylorella equigenitalis TaxID=29575 RepID=UPI0023AF49D2|nr:YceD family protein [Taylorella equigenitalis]WEE00860.1 YceD family protein [Taylorella equigenitalis]WEE02338.1 YceD family protein [Taylorella equigenitalis]WFD78877.1 YceD family protein [Taylorella equigenitalis]WFD80351.1 YceD family protein [Taylorella equigenitalis]WFD81830.1 YceD family protein [Taylorella equigenitalis]
MDFYDLIRNQKTISDTFSITKLNRVLEDYPLQDPSSLVEWAVSGVNQPLGPKLIKLTIKANPKLICQRCNSYFVYPLDIDTTLEVVSSLKDLEEDVDSSGEIADSEHDKILTSQAQDMVSFIEDEILLNIPYIPKHEECPEELIPHPKFQEEVKESPFAILKKLKNN